MSTVSVINELIYTFGVDMNQYHKCWSVGSNKNGQQGNKFNYNDIDQDNKRLMIMNKLPNNIFIDDIITGCWGSTYILCNDNRDLIVFGCNESGQLSIDFQVVAIIIKAWTKNINPLFTNIMITKDIIILTEKYFDKKLCWSFGSLLQPLKLENVGSSSPWMNNKNDLLKHKILFMSSGIPSHHKFIVTQDRLSGKDHLFGVGRNDHNQLGLSDKKTRDQFTEIKYFTNISVELAQIHCSRDYTHFLSEKGKLYESSDQSIAIRPIKNITTIVDICCGYEHTLAINENNWIYSWGDNLYGQLGLFIIYCNYNYCV